MKKNKPSFLIFAISLAMLSACNHRYYAPNSIQIPHLKNQHDAMISGGIGFGPEYSAWEAQAVYSPIKHGAVMVNYFTASSDRDKINDATGLSEWGKGNFVEVGLGGYQSLNQNSVLSIFGGVGKGNSYNFFGAERFADLNFRRLFFQTGLSTQYKFLHLGLGLRLCHLQFTNGLVDYKIDEIDRQIIERIREDSPMWLPEYAFQFGWRIGPVLLNNTLTYSPSNSGQKDARFAGSNIQLGVVFDLHHFWKKGE